MKTTPSPWHRLSYLLKTERLSLLPFILQLGLRRLYSLERIKNGQDIISPELAVHINELYPSYSIAWLLLGQGPHPGAAPDELPDLSGTLIGKWNLTHTYNYFADTDTWDAEQTFAPDESAWRFQSNGLAIAYEHGEIIDTYPYTYDPITAHICIRHIDAAILKLTDTEMEYLDWSEWPTEGLIKYIYKREPGNTKTVDKTNTAATIENLLSPFSGQWKVTTLCQKTGHTWKAYKHYQPGFFLWDFLTDGILLETIGDKPLRKTAYAFDPATNTLAIDRSDYAPDGFINACYEDRYWVGQITDNELWLYDTEEVENIPEGCKVRYRLNKL